jgi:hypothetical protein
MSQDITLVQRFDVQSWIKISSLGQTDFLLNYLCGAPFYEGQVRLGKVKLG